MTQILATDQRLQLFALYCHRFSSLRYVTAEAALELHCRAGAGESRGLRLLAETEVSDCRPGHRLVTLAVDRPLHYLWKLAAMIVLTQFLGWQGLDY